MFADISVANSKNFKPVVAQMCVTRGINSQMIRVEMLRAIDFDNKPLRKAGEIHDVAEHRVLTSEMITLRPELAKFPPKPPLGNCLRLAEPARNLIGHGKARSIPDQSNPIANTARTLATSSFIC